MSLFLEVDELEIFKNIIYTRSLQTIVLSFLSMLSCQIVKCVVMSIKNKEFMYSALFSTGGMPSSHTSIVATLITSMAMFQYTDTGRLDYSFAVALVFGFIVIHDAMGVRLEASKHAKILNKLVEDESFETKKSLGYGKKGQLKELLGHKQIEVLMGFLYGAFIGILGYFIILHWFPI